MPRKRPKTHDISRKRKQELLSDPRCIKDPDLSTNFTDAYQLSDGGVLLSTLGEGGVVYESREEYVALMAEIAERNATLEQLQLVSDSDEFLPQGEFFTEEVTSRLMPEEALRLVDEALGLEENLSQRSNYLYLYPTEQEDIPLAQRRGLDFIDLNDLMVLVRAPIEQVTQAFSQMRQAEFEHDIYEREVTITGQDFIVFQFQGHLWTLIHELGFSSEAPLGNEDAQVLAGLLSTRAIFYGVSDTCGFIGYELYDRGVSVEMLSFEDGDPEADVEVDERQGEFRSAQGVYQFRSQLRQLRTEENQNPHDPELSPNPYDVVEDFFRAQDAYAPAFFESEGFSVGEQVTFRIEGLDRDDFERTDYVVLK